MFDLIVVGAGHAGCEAASAAARMGASVALLTFKREQIARLSCNPAIGGLAKGCLVRELDALGGWMGQVADATTIQFRRLNTRKGLAVQSSRAQVDTHAYPREMTRRLDALPSLSILEAEVTGLLREGGAISGVRLKDGRTLLAPKVLLTTGTFLGALMHRGTQATQGGRIGEDSAEDLARELKDAGLRLLRLKTGTPPRLRRDSIDWSKTEVQETVVGRLSHTPVPNPLAPVTCTLTWTSESTHEVIRERLHESAMFSGAITGTGARYCPSIEDKVHRFPHRDRHQLFLEPEGHETDRVYVSGLSTSLPEETQAALLRTVPGLEDAEILQYGYAVEYEAADPRDLGPDLQHRHIPGLYLAGQVNGTSGYEEAAVQGFVAGVSAAQDRPFVLGRHQAYIGVLIDDLTTRGVGGEPYRMFSSRAEHRLLLREDNADLRLREIGREIGLVDDSDWSVFQGKVAAIAQAKAALAALNVAPSRHTQQRLADAGLPPLKRQKTGEELLRRKEISYAALQPLFPSLPELDPETAAQVETDIRYAGYIEREAWRARQAAKLHELPLEGLDFTQIPGLRQEVIERLQTARPANLASAARLPGIPPAAISVLAVYLRRAHAKTQTSNDKVPR
ncbi:MAG: tRNA uridine-5-carboxymethylaminomethyl(34) synthesis enzyme MnmG [Myxococcota bacterium]|nr:tRNA uridine-5-carboxymethylaminomethyl(34) synthesis enzyme MnmG [Myxococcota bacterium]